MDLGSRSVFGRASGLHGLSEFSLKRLIAWGDHLKVDQPQIDAQHEAIFTLAMEVADVWHRHGDLKQLKLLTEKLHKVLEAHFRYEEQQLAAIGYPQFAAHQAEHKAMLDEMQVLRARLDRMKEGTIQAEPGYLVLNFILGVTVGHIFHSDMDYCVFARKAAGEEGQAWHGS